VVRQFADSVDKHLIIEELEPFIEDGVRAAGIPCFGKELTGLQGELSVEKVRGAIECGNAFPKSGECCSPRASRGLAPTDNSSLPSAPPRSPALCPGCPHRAVFYTFNRLKLNVCGDIGCYTLGMLPPLSAMDTCLCMGASIGMALGMEKARGREFSRRTVAVIGDSTFMHSGITALLDCVYNNASVTVVILDNRITGMTGHQNNPASGFDIHGNPAPTLDIEALAGALGVSSARTVDPLDLKEFERVLKEEIQRDAVSVVIAKRPCALLPGQRQAPYHTRNCRNCGACMRIGCPALSRGAEGVAVDEQLCSGCGLCASVCPFDCFKNEQ
ncbi:MAG: 4Fe-4S binding protein, partial [Oscillospiraceae bacterium]|nr:4Fe-4S binding protein [Oscillospiraceae bacterium]